MFNESVSLCLDYILDNELEDFADNPSSNHVYYHAYKAYHGNKQAEAMLTEAVRDLEHTKELSNA
jgi:hypothetical protein